MKKITLLATLMIVALLGFITSASAIGTEKEYTPVPTSEDTVTAFISSIHNDNGHLTIKADPIEWYEGAAADQKFKEREKEAFEELGGAPDNYYIVNDDQTLHTYEVAPDAQVLMQIYDHDGTYEGIQINWNEPVSLDKYVAIMNNNKLMDMKNFPYHLVIQDGKVVKIIQQYIP
ncbi:hypothetical protein [Paenibacillus azoreducens]|uniref:DUF4309 domain-containing protein n=1 Tax=Paenibacillus azoreducens TaxID=116718 RepID=A0A919YAA2_9BACL|nr:hypothetical protein [Paenibacillus azoreducens]GIO46058.1 hypothetical protein J34TS1_08230 [Paenibacillus azoreducens]